jgi:hypothetical protein
MRGLRQMLLVLPVLAFVHAPAQKQFEFGAQLSPFAIATEDLRMKMILMDSLQLGITSAHRANPSLSAGIFANYRYARNWMLRMEANLMDRAIFYAVTNPFHGLLRDKFTSGAIATTVNSSITLHYNLSRKLTIGTGMAAQFHFTSGGDIDPTRSSRPDFIRLLNQADQAVKPVTLHHQISVLWRLGRWNLGASFQRSLTSMTTSVVHKGVRYPLPTLHTEIYLLNIGYRLLKRGAPTNL